MKSYTHTVAAAGPDRREVLGAFHTRPAFAVPPLACDCHLHIFGPKARYPMAANRTFSPGIASVDDVLAMHAQIGIERMVIVQASTHGTDNACVLDALADLHARGKQARAVAVVSPDASSAELKPLHEAGVRGLRVNLQSYGETDPAVAAARLQNAAKQAAAMGWHVQTYTTLPVIQALRETIRQLPVPLVVDHFGLADPALGLSQAGLPELLDLIAAGKVYVKLSAPYRILSNPDGSDGRALARAFIEANPARMLWGTDWPHTGAWPGVVRDIEKTEAFHPVDNGAQMNIFGSYASLQERQAILVDNPARLYDF